MTTQTELNAAAQAIIDRGMAVEADVLLPAITQREQMLKSERIDIAEWFEQAKADEIAGLRKQIADTEACLANWQERWRKDTEQLAPYLAALEAGRKDRPEVDRIRNDRASSDPQQGHPGWQYAYNSQGTLLSAIDELHLTEAALRVACDHKQEVIDGMQQEIIDLQSYKSLLPADWSKDSSLETWFPVTASMLERLQRELDEKQEVLAGVQVVLNERTAELAALKVCYDACYETAQNWMNRALPAEAMVAELKRQPTGRTPEQYAIEHGRYLATAAQAFMDSCNKVWSAQQAVDDDETDTENEAAGLLNKLDDAKESQSDHWKGLQSAIYEFAKRADRAYPIAQSDDPAQSAASGGPF